MFFSDTQAKIGYQEVSHLFASLIKHGGNNLSTMTTQELPNTERLKPEKSEVLTNSIESFLIEGN